MQFYVYKIASMSDKSKIKVLVACEFTGIVREAFRKQGFNAYSCDIIPAEDNSPYHIQCDVREILNDDSFNPS